MESDYFDPNMDSIFWPQYWIWLLISIIRFHIEIWLFRTIIIFEGVGGDAPGHLQSDNQTFSQIVSELWISPEFSGQVFNIFCKVKKKDTEIFFFLFLPLDICMYVCGLFSRVFFTFRARDYCSCRMSIHHIERRTLKELVVVYILFST